MSSAGITTRNCSDFEIEFMLCAHLPIPTQVSNFQRQLADHDCLRFIPRSKLSGRGKPADPYHVIPAHHYWPKLPLPPGDMPFLQEFLDFPRRFGMGGPEAISCAPVSHAQLFCQ